MPLQRELKTINSFEPNDRGDYIITQSGIKFYALDPRSEEISINDIAHALSMVNRWTGHTIRPMSVAEHSIIVSQLVPEEYAMHGLLHDASEAYIADIARPFKPYFDNYKDIESSIMAAVSEKFKLKWTDAAHAAVDKADRSMLIIEARNLFPPYTVDWTDAPALKAQCYENVDSLSKLIKVGMLSQDDAKRNFYNRYLELRKRG